jgi:glycerol-3-phosphate dehydrogenase
MIHGGPRYLEFDWNTTRLSCEDAGHIVRIARHLVHRVLFLLPVLPGDRNNIERMETAMEVYDRFQPLKLAHPHVRLSALEARTLEPGLTDRLVGAVTMEEWGVDPHRLAWANVEDAIEHGAAAENHAAVTGLQRQEGRIAGVRYRSGGVEKHVRARVVVNAAGPWAGQVARLAGVEIALRPAKGIHIVYDRRLSNFALSAEAVDGRSLLLIPHGAFTLLGTTDDDYYGDLDAVEVLPDEVDYLLQAFERVMPGISAHRAVRATTGVRPTLFKWRPYEDDLSRRYEVIDHGVRDGVAGLVSVVGGKLSMYRRMAEDSADAVCEQLGVVARSTTADKPLPGGAAAPPPAEEVGRRHGVSAAVAARLLRRHGDQSEAVLGATPGPRVVCRCEGVTDAELRYACRREQAAGVADAFRRVGLGAGPCAGSACVDRASEVVGDELGWSSRQQREAALAFLRAMWVGRAPVLGPDGWAQEELAYGGKWGYRL